MEPKLQKDPSPEFIEACNKAGIPPTNRQHRKFMQRRGLAWEAHNK